jgi:hypothetical protein
MGQLGLDYPDTVLQRLALPCFDCHLEDLALAKTNPVAQFLDLLKELIIIWQL